MCKIYGYARISTKKQNIERQVRNIQTAFPAAIISQEVFTGTKFQNREKLQNIIKKAKDGDTIVFDSVSRMARNAEDGTKLYFELYDKGINLVFLKERHIDTDAYKEALKAAGISIDTDDTAEGELISDIVNALNKFMRAKVKEDIRKAFDQAEKEVTDLHERTKEGIETARRSGKAIGGAATAGQSRTSKKSIEAKEKIKKYSKSFGGQMGNVELMEFCNITEPTLLKYKKEIRAELIEAGQMEEATV